jgi:uncharacterized membrane protein
VGAYKDASFKTHGFSFKGGKYTKLDVKGSNGTTTATGINNSGDIVLYSDQTSGHFKSSLYNGSTYTTINVNGAKDSFAQGINTSGNVVYWIGNATGIHGALRQGSNSFVFDDPHGVGTTHGWGLNDHRQIVGYYGTAGDFHGFEATY